MEKTIPLRLSIFGLLCTLLLCLGSLPAVGQNCPNFQWNDFTKTMVHPNADCNLPGSLTIRYSNNINSVPDRTALGLKRSMRRHRVRPSKRTFRQA